MRYLKLFEQFEDEESWWDEGSKFDVYTTDKLMLFGNNDTNTLFVGSVVNGEILFFKNLKNEIPHYLSDRYFRIVPLNNVKKDGMIAVYDMGHGINKGWSYYTLDTLPKEIKDRLI